jgi:hypothetical protein
MPQRSSNSDDTAFRLGAGALGLFAGAAVGVLVGWLGYVVVGLGPSFEVPVLGGLFAGLVSGLLLPAETMALVEAVVHFFIGFFAATAGEPVESPAEAPSYVKLACLFGAALVLALFVLSHLR